MSNYFFIFFTLHLKNIFYFYNFKNIFNLLIIFHIHNGVFFMEKFTTYYILLEEIAKEGCPICSLSNKTQNAFIENLFYENVNEPHLRKKLRSSLGFCAEHSKLVLAFGDALGTSIIMNDIITDVLNTLENYNFEFIPADCPVCIEVRKAEQRYIDEFIQFASDNELQNTYKNSSFLLCLNHYCRLICKLKKNKQKIYHTIQLEKLRRLKFELSEFIRKNNYSNKDEEIKSEGNAWIRAIKFLT